MILREILQVRVSSSRGKTNPRAIKRRHQRYPLLCKNSKRLTRKSPSNLVVLK